MLKLIRKILCWLGIHYPWIYYTTHSAIYKVCKNCEREYFLKDWHTIWHYLEPDFVYYINPKTIIEKGF